MAISACIRQGFSASVFRPFGLPHCPDPTQGLRPGLQSYAALRLGWDAAHDEARSAVSSHAQSAAPPAIPESVP